MLKWQFWDLQNPWRNWFHVNSVWQEISEEVSLHTWTKKIKCISGFLTFTSSLKPVEILGFAAFLDSAAKGASNQNSIIYINQHPVFEWSIDFEKLILLKNNFVQNNFLRTTFLWWWWIEFAKWLLLWFFKVVWQNVAK